MTNPTRVITPSKTPRTRSKGEKKISLGGKQMRGVVVRHFVLKRALYAAKVLCKMSAAVEKRTSLFWRIADGQSQTCERNGRERFMSIRQSRSRGTGLTLAKDGRKRRKRVKTRLAVFVLCASSLLSGQAMKIEARDQDKPDGCDSGDQPEYSLPADMFTRSTRL